MILKGAFEVLKEGVFSLLDAADAKLTEKINRLVCAEPGITHIKRLTVRKSGSVYFANIVLSIAEPNTDKAHQKIDRIVEHLHRKISNLESVTIHYEPDHPPYKMTVELLTDDKKTLSKRFGSVPWLRVVKTQTNGNIITDEIIANPAISADKGRAFRLAAWLISQHADTVTMGTTELDENIKALFETLNIEFSQKTTSTST